MRRVVWTPSALADFDEIVSYWRAVSPAAEATVARRIFDAASSLDLFAERGRPLSSGRRELLSAKPYVIRYRIEGDFVRILSVRHGARRPLS